LPSFASLDTNHDGAVTKFEAQNDSVVDHWDKLAHGCCRRSHGVRIEGADPARRLP